MEPARMTDRAASFSDLVGEYRKCLRALGGDAPFVAEIETRLDAVDLTGAIAGTAEATGIQPPDDVAALARSIRLPVLRPLASCIERAAPHLAWKDCSWYPRDRIGEGFARAHAYASLVGPGERVFQAADFSIGLFLIGSRVLYRDHRHQAPELYFNLTGPSGWRFERGDWHDLDAGTFVWNEPLRVHATRVYETPWLCIYCWTKDLDKSSFVVPAPDWAEIETALQV
jgi:hypothetical protein